MKEVVFYSLAELRERRPMLTEAEIEAELQAAGCCEVVGEDGTSRWSLEPLVLRGVCK
jgi:hypothetical protein